MWLNLTSLGRKEPFLFAPGMVAQLARTGFQRAAGHRGRLPANIYYPTEIVSFDGVLQALRGPDLRACRNVETNLASRDSLSVLNLL